MYIYEHLYVYMPMELYKQVWLYMRRLRMLNTKISTHDYYYMSFYK